MKYVKKKICSRFCENHHALQLAFAVRLSVCPLSNPRFRYVLIASRLCDCSILLLNTIPCSLEAGSLETHFFGATIFYGPCDSYMSEGQNHPGRGDPTYLGFSEIKTAARSSEKQRN